MVEWSLQGTGDDAEESQGARCLVLERQDFPEDNHSFQRSIFLMQNQTGVQDAGNLAFSFDPSFEELIVHRIRIHRDGRILERLDPAKVRIIQPESELAGHVFTGVQEAVVFVEDLRVGDALELATSVRGANPALADHYFARFRVQGGMRVGHRRFRVIWTRDRALRIRQHLIDAPPTARPWAEGTEYVWDFVDLPATPAEDLVPAPHEPFAYVEVSDFSSWGEVVDWALPLYAVETAEAPSDLQALIRDWRAAPSEEERSRRALQFIQDDLRYTGIELGVGSYLPSAPYETFRLRYGDCKAKAVLFCTILGKLGIEAHPALVNVSAREGIERALPSPLQFDHVIVQLVMGGRTLWVDPTRSHQGGLMGNRYLPGFAKALVIKPGVSAFEDVPAPLAHGSGQRVTSTFSAEAHDSLVSLTIRTIYRGSDADAIREFLARNNAETMSKGFLDYYSRYYPHIESVDLPRVEDERSRNQIEVVERYRIGDFWQIDESGQRLLARIHAESMEDLLPAPATRIRRMPLVIPYPLQREQENIVHLPDGGWDVSDLETEVEHEAFSFRYRRRGSGSTIRFLYECRTKVSEIPAASVASYIQRRGEMRELLGDVLYRGLNGSSAARGSVNWPVAVLAGAVLAATVAASLRFWRRTAAAPAVAAGGVTSPDDAEAPRPGGWLILVGIGLCVAPITRGVALVRDWEAYFLDSAWMALATPGGGAYHPLHGPVLVFELLGNLVLFGWTVLTAALFFARRRVFPKTYVRLLIANLLFLLLDFVAGSLLPSDADGDDRQSVRALINAASWNLIWILYMLRSKRVKLTFVR